MRCSLSGVQQRMGSKCGIAGTPHTARDRPAGCEPQLECSTAQRTAVAAINSMQKRRRRAFFVNAATSVPAAHVCGGSTWNRHTRNGTKKRKNRLGSSGAFATKYCSDSNDVSIHRCDNMPQQAQRPRLPTGTTVLVPLRPMGGHTTHNYSATAPCATDTCTLSGYRLRLAWHAVLLVMHPAGKSRSSGA